MLQENHHPHSEKNGSKLDPVVQLEPTGVALRHIHHVRKVLGTLVTDEAQMAIPKTVRARGESSDVVFEKDPIIIAIEKEIAAKTDQLDRLLDLIADRKPGSAEAWVALAQGLRSVCPSYTEAEVIAIVSNQDQVRNDSGLRRALIVGGEHLKDDQGEVAIIYTRYQIAMGGVATIKAAYLLLGNQFVSAVVKEPHRLTIDAHDPNAEEKERRRLWFLQSHLVEAMNAQAFKQKDLPHTIKPLFVSQATKDRPLPIIVYKKVTDRRGEAVTFAQVFSDDRIIPSQKVRALATAVEGMAAWHAAGEVHLDLKPQNIMLSNSDVDNPATPSEATIVDLGSYHAITDQTKVTLTEDDEPSLIERKVTLYGQEVWFPLGYTPQFLDVVLLHIARKQGKGPEVADRYALGACIMRLLIGSKLIAEKTEHGYTPTYASLLNLAPDQFPPASVVGLLKLAHELQDIASYRPLRPLAEIAIDMRKLAEAMTKDVDNLHQKYASEYKFTINSTL